MRITQVLLRQHLGFAFKRNWIVKNKKRPLDVKSEEYVKERGFQVVDACEYIKKIENEDRVKNLKFDIPVVGIRDLRIPRNENHPEYMEEECHVQKDTLVLLEGLQQAQIITKTHVVSTEQLPEKIEKAALQEHPEEVHNQVKRILLYSNIFDCEQEKLPHIKDPVRPAYTFPRILGITDVRRNLLTTSKIVDLLDKTSDFRDHLHLSRDVESMTTFRKDNDLFQIQFNVDTLITSDKPLSAINSDYEDTTPNQELPTLYPMTHRISFQLDNFYKIQDVYPIKDKTSRWYNPHTTILHHNITKLKNLHGSPVTVNQLWGRSLMHAFCIAAPYAKSLYGDSVQLLPKPITIQCIQTDGCNYYLGVFQLNTLDVNGSKGVKNLWYQAPVMRMFDNCKYINARPYLDGYNPTVFNYLSAVYRNT